MFAWRLDTKALRNILIASGVMGGVILFLRLVVPLFHVIILLAAVFFGALLYFVVLLKLDSSIRSELSNIALQTWISHSLTGQKTCIINNIHR